MNVLMLTDKLIHGGAENYFCRLENELPNDKLTLYTVAGPGELESQIKHKEKFYSISRKRHLRNMMMIRKLIVKKKIDVIHANSLRMVLYLIAITMNPIKKRTIKVVYTKHNVTSLEKYPTLFSWILNKYVDRIIAVSEFEKENIIKNGVNESKVKTVYNGVDLKKFRFQPKLKGEHYKVGILARLSEEKNHSFFIDIANEFRHMSNLTFYIAGDGPEYQSITEKINSMGLSNKVVLVGNAREPEKFIAEMDLMLLTSKLEVFPMVMLETMAVGTPILTINVGGIKEAVINNETGFLVEKYYVKSFCDIIYQLIENDDLSHQLVQQARNKVEIEFSMEKMVESTLNEYMQVSHM
ncbi:glycosyltransferase family 4 protein [Anaerobacillus sp. 1_MG-2023]|uniref:glycosyltransferase family 4 protein n=1 Tax=Bacillales TaxID=1385 RepID=UPI0026E1CF6B|nr:glycosyltransferase family 4 protein [Anaerobacillus sp. 1_MG-2023]MDO6657814.1 glycosyltransferase family 4 protein [Anaerobacillus sp. 1_MG-2023]